MPSIGVGENCVFYDGGDSSLKPKPAIVIEVDENNMEGPVTLRLFNVADALKAERRNVRHLSDPEYLLNPEAKREWGAWDTIKGAQQRREQEIAERRRLVQNAERDRDRRDRERNEAKDQEKREQTVLSMKRNGKTMGEISTATLLTTKEIKFILNKYGEKDPVDDPDKKQQEPAGTNS